MPHLDGVQVTERRRDVENENVGFVAIEFAAGAKRLAQVQNVGRAIVAEENDEDLGVGSRTKNVARIDRNAIGRP